MMPPKSPVYKLMVDGRLKATGTADLAEAQLIAKGLLEEGRQVSVVDITTGKVIPL